MTPTLVTLVLQLVLLKLSWSMSQVLLVTKMMCLMFADMNYYTATEGVPANAKFGGEVWIRGPSVALGYYKDEKKTKEVCRYCCKRFFLCLVLILNCQRILMKRDGFIPVRPKKLFDPLCGPNSK